jgi:hypothetical protein
MIDSVSWISLGLSALLVLEKFLTKNKLKRCKCCGACFEFESQSSPSPSHHKQNHEDKNDEQVIIIKITLK